MKKKLLFVVAAIIFTMHGLNGQIQSTVFLSGDMNSWETDAMTYRDLGIDNWILTLQYTGTTGNNNFKFRNSSDNWNQNWGHGAVVSLDSKTIWYNNGDNGSLSFTNNKYYTFIFKDVGSGVNSEGTVIETASEPVTISSTYRIPEVVYAWQKPIVYATLSGSLPDGQSVYVRYTTNNFVNSTIIELELFSGNTYKAELSPVGLGTVNYYFFTSGTGLTITPSDADIFTINLLNNNGSNYSYTIQSGNVRFSNTAGTSNWDQTTTWEDGTIPNSTDNVVIQHNVVLNQNSTVNSLLVNKDVSFDVNSSSELSISNDLSNNGTLTIKSFASGTGSLIVNGTSSGTISFERYLTGYSGNEANGWHFLALPISGLTIAGSSFEPTEGTDDLYQFDQNQDENVWLNYFGADFSETEFVVGKGYLVAYNTTATKTFSGNTIRTSDLTVNLDYTAGKPYTGWNLVGNPFTSAIDWDNIEKSENVYGSVYVINSIDGTFESWNGTTGDLTGGIIPANQGFLVHASTSSQSITMAAGSDGDQVHNTSTFYKNQTELAENTLKISVGSEIGSNNTYLQLREDATENFDADIDAYKLFGYGSITEVYSHDESNLYSINCMPNELQGRQISIGINSKEEKEHYLTFEGIQNLQNEYEISLEDTKTNAIHEITEDFIYNFQTEAINNPNRFLLHFGMVGIGEQEQAPTLQVYMVDNRLYVNNSLEQAQLAVYDLQGRLVARQSLNSGGLQALPLELPAGVYIVRLNNASESRTVKINVQ